jgi:hypothetical protein
MMYARMTTYHLQVTDLQRWIGNLERLMGAPDDAPALRLLADLDGCRGVWFLVRADEQSYESDLADARERLQRGETSAPDGYRETILSYWDTREQAETVRERLGDRLGQFFDIGGLTLTRPPDTTIFRVEGGRMLQPAG